MTPEEAAAFDLAHVWHPFTQMKDHQTDPPVPIAGAEGVDLILGDGRRVLDDPRRRRTHGTREPWVPPQRKQRRRRYGGVPLLERVGNALFGTRIEVHGATTEGACLVLACPASETRRAKRVLASR